MTFPEKQAALLNKLQSNNFEQFKNNQKIAQSFIQNNLLTIAEYVNTVIRQQIMIPIWTECSDEKKYTTAIAKRKAAYGYAVISAGQLNKISKIAGTDTLFENKSPNLCYDFSEYVQQIFIKAS